MKTKEIRDLSPEELTKKIDGWEEELFNLRFQAKMGQLANPLQLRLVRRDIARAKTVLNEKVKVESASEK
ncbi:MAG TPA: 50S ribosomal protein L29 [Chitinispirillaceae bacterium]|jgi:large subunit ribosomal protein L29|nr:50S ribosomal protein L29 [Chitinispirillaceae bacterium]